MITINKQNIYNTKNNHYFLLNNSVYINTVVYNQNFNNIDNIIKKMNNLGFTLLNKTININCLLCFKSNNIDIDNIKKTINIQ